MNESVLRFYNDLAEEYHLIFPDWPGPVRRQGAALDALIRAELGEGVAGPLTILDCSCGIGTQAIGLALQGHRVHATDLSPAAVERARQEAESLGVSLTFGVADFRTLAAQVPGQFEVVLSCDNSLPHLLTDEDLLKAARHMHAKLKPGGLLLVSIRDYDGMLRERPRAEVPRVFDGPGGRRVVLHVWDWAPDGRTATLHLFIVRQADAESGVWRTSHYATPYRALLRDELTAILEQAGFADVHWYLPDEHRYYYQPVVLARKWRDTYGQERSGNEGPSLRRLPRHRDQDPCA